MSRRALVCVVSILSLFALFAPLQACDRKQPYILSVKMDFTAGTIMERSEPTVPLFVAVAHTSDFVLFKPTQLISDEAAQIASNHEYSKIVQRLKDLRDENIVRSWAIMDDLEPDKMSQLQLTVDNNATKISFMVTLSPSPAWFVGQHAYDVCQDGKLVLELRDIKLKTYSSGLDSGTSFTSDLQRFEEQDREPVSEVTQHANLATFSLEQGTLGVNWWKILLGVLIGVAVLIIIAIFVYPRLRRKRNEEIPLTQTDDVDF